MLDITEKQMEGERERERERRHSRENQTASVKFRGTLAFVEEKFSSQINMLCTLSFPVANWLAKEKNARQFELVSASGY